MFMKLALLSYMRTRRTTCLYLMCLVFDSFFPVLFEGFMTTEKKTGGLTIPQIYFFFLALLVLTSIGL